MLFSVNLLNMHQVTIPNAAPIHTEVIKLNMIHGWVLKLLNLKLQPDKYRRHSSTSSSSSDEERE